MTGSPAGVDPAPADDALALARRLLALEEGPIRVRAAARALAAIEPGRAAAAIAALVRAPDAELRAAAVAVARALEDPGADLPYGWLADLYEAARARELEEVTALLVAPPPQRVFAEPRDRAAWRGGSAEPEEALPDRADGREGRPRPPGKVPITLGHKKAFARSHRDPDLLARLAAEGDPVVVRELLRNPLLTEELVVRIAARRPCRPGTLRCVAEARPWRSRPAVALAIVRNPYAEPALALALLPAIGTADLRDLARDGALHPLVRALAERVAGRRGP